MKMTYFLPVLLIAFAMLLVRCNSANNVSPSLDEDVIVAADTTNDSLSDDPYLPEIDHCGPRSIADFGEFLGFNYSDEEKVITRILGGFSGGAFSPDSAYFIYYFNQLKTVPIEVWVDAKSSKIVTVFIEVLSLEEAFKADIKNAIVTYGFNACDLSWLGMTADQLILKLGKPAEDAVSREDIRLISYDSPDYLIGVAFKFFPQAPVCSSISVNWFYKDHIKMN